MRSEPRRAPSSGTLIHAAQWLPQREIAAAAQARFVGRPVQDAVAGPRYAMALSGVVLEQHGRNLPASPRPGYPGIRAPTPFRCPGYEPLGRC